MKFPILAMTALAVTACTTAGYDEAASEKVRLADAEVEKRLTGYSPTGSRSCLPSRPSGSLKFYDNGTVLIQQGGTYYRQELDRGCARAASPHTTIVTEGTYGSMCAGEIVRVVDSTSGGFYGSCALGKWTAWEKSGNDG
ncbi:hypothetical protein [Sphingomicrobium lutaoense]|uniref:Lipoprotein n=1 Tax=Sphingomicrobium lutaoense TaxID=515949 RepID=A0A839Z3I7_9SPHN|nr:hypothetical protein [Sphingomicrobium lutaoense]MBB3764647.1 hypothetical protein [Sphingomicrobium lutaoense]